MPQNNIGQPQTVLITRFSALGDVAMTVPVIYSACRCYPHIRFVMVTRPAMCSIFVNPPENLTLFGADIKDKYAGLAGLRHLTDHLYNEFHPDVLVDLHSVLRTHVISALMRLKGVRTAAIEKPRKARRRLTRRFNKVLLPLTPQRQLYYETFAKAGLPVQENFDGLYGGQTKAPAADYAPITRPKPADECWIGIAPFAAHAGKIYPPEMMEKVVRHLQERANAGTRLRVFLFGGGDSERAILDRWAYQYSVATSLAGKRYGFKAELALINHLDALLSMDSANMHLGAIAGTPTLSIWGATHPYCGFRGWGQEDADILQVPVDCRPCSVFGDKACYRRDLHCLRAIRPELVYDRLMRMAGL